VHNLQISCSNINTNFVGFTTIVPQIIVSFAAHLAESKERGKIIGIVMSGVLIGSLLSRIFSGDHLEVKDAPKESHSIKLDVNR